MKPRATINVDETTQVPEEIWTAKDGRQIPVGALSEEHAKNILRMILRNRRKRHARSALRERAEQDAWNEINEDRKWGSD